MNPCHENTTVRLWNKKSTLTKRMDSKHCGRQQSRLKKWVVVVQGKRCSNGLVLPTGHPTPRWRHGVTACNIDIYMYRAFTPNNKPLFVCDLRALSLYVFQFQVWSPSNYTYHDLERSCDSATQGPTSGEATLHLHCIYRIFYRIRRLLVSHH